MSTCKACQNYEKAGYGQLFPPRHDGGPKHLAHLAALLIYLTLIKAHCFIGQDMVNILINKSSNVAKAVFFFFYKKVRVCLFSILVSQSNVKFQNMDKCYLMTFNLASEIHVADIKQMIQKQTL